MIRITKPEDVPAIIAMVEDSGQFDEDGLRHVRSTLQQHLDGESAGIWLTSDDGEPVGVAYCEPEPVASGAWNLLMLWTRRDRHGLGHGTALVGHLEGILSGLSARLLVVETSGLPDFAPARDFYGRCGFVHEATIRDFFAQGDDKLVFTKSLVGR